MKVRLGLLTGLCIAFLGVPGSPLRASDAPGFDARLVDLVATGQVAEAQALLEETNPSPEDRAFLRGRVLKANGQFEAAIAVFRSILQRVPTYINARRELAHTLLLHGDFRAASHHFRALLQVDPDPRMRQSYHIFLSEIDREQPLGIAGHFAMLPSTNINRGTMNTVFDPGNPNIPPSRITSRAASGVGLLLGLSGYLRHPLSRTDRLVFDWSVTGRGYEDAIHNSATLSLGARYQRRAVQYQWFVGPYARKTWREDDDDNSAIGLQAGLDRRIGARTSVFVQTSYEERTYPDAAPLDGPFFSGSGGVAFSPRPDLTFVGGVRLDESRPNALHQNYTSGAVFGRVIKQWPGGLTTGMSFEIGTRDYKDTFPLTSRTRGDEFLRIDASFQNANLDWRGFTPVLTCSHTVNRSNIAFFDYDVSECQIGLTRNF